MSKPRTRVTRRGLVVLTCIVLVLGVLVVVVIDHVRGPDCTVRAGGRTVGMDRDQAEHAGTLVAAGMRRSASQDAITTSVRRGADLSAADAGSVVLALTGQARAALFCRYGGASSTESDRLSSEGLTARAERVFGDVRSRFGDVPYGGFAPGGVHNGHMPGSAHYEGRAIDFFYRPISSRDKTRGWALAQYLVTQAARLNINTVIFDARIWTAAHAGKGWRVYSVSHSGKSRSTVQILEHRDHVHVDVAD
jgi:hypothetical protein